MMKCGDLLGLCRNANRDSRHEKQSPGTSVAINSIMISKNACIRIIHAGGQMEVFENAVPASHLMEKYPGMCVAHPEVFKNPSASLLLPDDYLLLGHKYYIIPLKTAEKLKIRQQNQQNKVKIRAQAESIVDISYPRITWDVSEENMEASVSSAKDFYNPKKDEAMRSRHFYRRSGRVKKPFAPPLPRTRNGTGAGWEPSLTSVQEISP